MNCATGYGDIMDIGADRVDQRLVVLLKNRPKYSGDFSHVDEAAMETVADLVVLVDEPQPIALVDQMNGQPVGALVGVEYVAKIPDTLGDCIPDLAVDAAIATDGFAQGSHRAVAGVLVPGLTGPGLEIRLLQGLAQQARSPSRRAFDLVAGTAFGLPALRFEEPTVRAG